MKVKAKVDEGPLNALSFVLLLFKDEHRVVEQLLELLVRVVNAKLLERVQLKWRHFVNSRLVNGNRLYVKTVKVKY